jgi:Mor family transcriptional regulator
LYLDPAQSEKPLSTQQRNEQIRMRHADGETLESLAREFNISVQRIHQIVHSRNH